MSTEGRLLKRRITAVKGLDSEKYKSIPTLHFEGITDCYFIMEFCQKNKNWGKGKQGHFVHSEGKKEAIKHHIEAINLGFRISTIVDMDHDFENHDISQEILGSGLYIKHPNIRSTNPGCTLFTLLLLDKGIMKEAIKRISLLNEPSDYQINLILEHATERTLKRIGPVLRDEEELKEWGEKIQKKFPNPMNDHSLCESIYLHHSGTYQEEDDGWVWRSLGNNNKTKKEIEKSIKDSANEFGSKTLGEIVSSMWVETETTF